ncbi:MAG: SurA N-terminal domain-containing protein [Mariprofundaceae bacterium]|nr:SurA N-terminal domain-containing protein [Mariprofundaceae bacterium]
MLESMRNQAQSWIAKVILGGIVLSFALWGVGDYFMGSQVEYVAEVDGKPITDSTFIQTYERQLNAFRATLGKAYSKELAEERGLKENTIQTLINRRLMLEEAQKLGLAAPEAALTARLQADPAFQSPDGFDLDRYKIITRNMGYRTTRDYEDEQRLNLMVNALQQAILASAHVNDRDIRESFNREFEQRVLSAIIVDPASIGKKIKIDDAQARAYFEGHQQKYRSPLKVKLTAVEISPETFTTDMAIEAADVESAYNERIAEYTTPERRHARHILIQAEDDEASRKASLDRANAVKARLDAGEAFAAVARELSDDKSTADKGGDLGFFAHGVMLPEFDEVVFSTDIGKVSNPVESQYGYHLVKIEAIQPAAEIALKDVYEKIADDLRKARATDEAYKVSQDLENALGMEDSLKAAAAIMNLKAVEIGPISADEALGDELLGSDAALRVRAFSALPGEIVEIQELDDGRFVALEISERIEPDTLSFADAAVQVYEDARIAQAEEKAENIAAEIVARAAETPMETLAQQHGQPLYISKPVRSSGIGDEADWLTPTLLRQAFKGADKSVLPTPVKVSKGFAVVHVKEIISPSDDKFEAEKESMRVEVERAKGAVRFARWMATIRDNHDIIVHRNILERF